MIAIYHHGTTRHPERAVYTWSSKKTWMWPECHRHRTWTSSHATDAKNVVLLVLFERCEALRWHGPSNVTELVFVYFTLSSWKNVFRVNSACSRGLMVSVNDLIRRCVKSLNRKKGHTMQSWFPLIVFPELSIYLFKLVPTERNGDMVKMEQLEAVTGNS